MADLEFGSTVILLKTRRRKDGRALPLTMRLAFLISYHQPTHKNDDVLILTIKFGAHEKAEGDDDIGMKASKKKRGRVFPKKQVEWL